MPAASRRSALSVRVVPLVLYRVDHPDDLSHRSDVMDTQDPRAVGCRPGDGGGGAEKPPRRVRLAGDAPDKPLPARADDERPGRLDGDFREPSQKLEVV